MYYRTLWLTFELELGLYCIWLFFVSYISSGRIGPLTCLLQPALSLAAVAASLQVVKPIFCLSPSTVLLHVTFGRPLVLFPSGAQVKAMRGFCWLFMRNTCPIQRHLCQLINSLANTTNSLHGNLVLSSVAAFVLSLSCPHYCCILLLILHVIINKIILI